ncbi:MAG: glycosyl transferase family 2, partial [bacterium]|nr:glycosyl transferase family 2 [bacterium]
TMGARSKFASIGRARRASEFELILCNLSFRKEIIRKAGGFNELLYPNEENELLNRLEYIGYKFVYDPQAIINRSRRNNIWLLFRQIFGYGRGRMEHLMVNPSFFEPVFLAPMLFIFYLLLLPFFKARFLREPLRWYSWLACGTGVMIALREEELAAFMVCPLIFLTVHIAYGMGLISGYLKQGGGAADRPETVPVTCYNVKTFESDTWLVDGS